MKDTMSNGDNSNDENDTAIDVHPDTNSDGEGSREPMTPKQKGEDMQIETLSYIDEYSDIDEIQLPEEQGTKQRTQKKWYEFWKSNSTTTSGLSMERLEELKMKTMCKWYTT
jgi:hypothetical protein